MIPKFNLIENMVVCLKATLYNLQILDERSVNVNRRSIAASTILPFLLMAHLASAQLTAPYFPIGDNPSLRWMSSYTSQETILFEASPTVRFSFSNSMDNPNRQVSNHRQAYYLAARPQLRMYTDQSRPVKTPSYRILLGMQHMIRFPEFERSEREARFISVALESGHYSNGQSGCAFSKQFADETDECDNVYTTITPQTDLSDLLNRENGNFSTNLTELIVDYRSYQLDEKQAPRKMHSFQLGYILYHNRFLMLAPFGGFSENDIAIYGRHRVLFAYEYMDFWRLGKSKKVRVNFRQTAEAIGNPHEHVNPWRIESTASVYPFTRRSPAFGFMVSLMSGHDNYNYRFVDSGTQISIGITWDQFPPFPFTGGKDQR